jgi:L-fuculose-phosphate aldolase
MSPQSQELGFMIPETVLTVAASPQTGNELKHRRKVCRIGRWLYKQGFVVASEGNLSVRLDADRILVTPAGVCKGWLTPTDLIVTDLEGAVVSGKGRPSSELQMHLLYYRLRPDVQAACHAHPPTATGFAATGRSLEAMVLPEVVTVLGKIPLAPYGTPGTVELCAKIEPLAARHDAILLENHGVVTVGADLVTAYQHMETVEHFARVMLTAESLGGPRLLTRAEVRKLRSAGRGTQRSLSRTQDKLLSSANRPNRFEVAPLECKEYCFNSGANRVNRS